VKKRKRLYSPLYQRCIIVTKQFRNLVRDTSACWYFAESFVPFPGESK
jgi:hypothetical protein